MTHGGNSAFFQNFSSPALTAWDRQYREDSEQKDHSNNESMNEEGVYRTAPATPGLINIQSYIGPIHPYLGHI